MRSNVYALFAGDQYYPAGGFADLIGTYGSLAEAKEAVSQDADWAHVVNLETLTIVAGYTAHTGRTDYSVYPKKFIEDPPTWIDL